MAPALSPEEVIKRTEDRFERCHELEIIKEFVKENAEDGVIAVSTVCKQAKCERNQ